MRLTGSERSRRRSGPARTRDANRHGGAALRADRVVRPRYGSGVGGLAGAEGDCLDLLGRTIELLVGEHGRALEREIALQLEP